jgi:P27 family predicted phage terminase small subunit
MTRGRKPDAPGLQAAKGNPGKRKPKPRTKTAPVVPLVAGGVTPPKWLKKSRVATAVWNDMAPLLIRLGALTQLDAFPLARYCRYVVDWCAADEAVRKEGTWYDTTDTNGAATKKRHPAFHARQDLDKTLREIEMAFGMRPDARFKMLRDQALANGMPLFQQGAAPNAAKGGEEGQADDDEDGPDLIGAIAQFDSAPPGSSPH